MIFFHKYKIIIDLKVASFLKKLNHMKKNVKMIFCDNAGKKTIEEDCAKHFKEIYLEVTRQSTEKWNCSRVFLKVILWCAQWWRMWDYIKTSILSYFANAQQLRLNFMVKYQKETFTHKKLYGNMTNWKKYFKTFR